MKILVLDIAASKTGALSVLKDFYGYVREHPCEGSDGTSSSIVKDKSILPSAVEPPADAPGLSGEDAAEAAKIRRRKRQSKKNFVVSYNSVRNENKCTSYITRMPDEQIRQWYVIL